MAFYAIGMATIATVLYRSGRPDTDLVLKFLEHFASITEAIDSQGLWDDNDGLYYDRLLTQDGTAMPVKVRSMVGVIPMLGAVAIDERMLDRAFTVSKQFADYTARPAWTTGRSWPRPGWCAATIPATGGCCSAWSAWTGWRSSSPSCSARTSSCPRTGCAPCPPTTGTTPTC